MPINTQRYGNTQGHSEIDQRDNGSVTHHQDEEIRLAEVQRHIEGVRFPANKNDLVEHATERQAPRRVIDLLQQLPAPEYGSSHTTKPRLYNSLDEVARELQKVG